MAKADFSWIIPTGLIVGGIYILKKYGDSIFSGVSSASQGIGSGIGTAISGTGTGLSSAITGLGTGVSDIATSLGFGTSEILTTTGESVSSVLSLPGTVADYIKQLWEGTYNYGYSLATGSSSDKVSVLNTATKADTLNVVDSIAQSSSKLGSVKVSEGTVKTSSVESLKSSTSSSGSSTYTYSSVEKANNLMAGSIEQAKSSTNKALQNWAKSFE